MLLDTHIGWNLHYFSGAGFLGSLSKWKLLSQSKVAFCIDPGGYPHGGTISHTTIMSILVTQRCSVLLCPWGQLGCPAPITLTSPPKQGATCRLLLGVVPSLWQHLICAQSLSCHRLKPRHRSSNNAVLLASVCHCWGTSPAQLCQLV